MGLISTLFVHKVVDAATGDAADPARRRALLRSAGVDPDAAVDPSRMIPAGDYYALCERVAREDPLGPALPVRVGASMRCDDYGAFGLAFKTAVDLRGSYLRAARYGRVLTSVTTHALTREGGRVFFELRREGERRLGLRLSNEQTLVAVVQISREVSSRPFVPVAVEFRHPPPADISAQEAWFGCPVRHGAPRDAIEVTEQALGVPNRLGDPGVSAFLDSHLDDAIAALADPEGLADRVRHEIERALPEGVPGVASVADRLGLSARTLQRRLAEEGQAFQDLVDGARRDLAERLLRRTDYGLAEVAFLTGFSEQSAFTRAFRRWHGRTPARFRRDATAA